MSRVLAKSGARTRSALIAAAASTFSDPWQPIPDPPYRPLVIAESTAMVSPLIMLLPLAAVHEGLTGWDLWAALGLHEVVALTLFACVLIAASSRQWRGALTMSIVALAFVLATSSASLVAIPRRTPFIAPATIFLTGPLAALIEGGCAAALICTRYVVLMGTVACRDSAWSLRRVPQLRR